MQVAGGRYFLHEHPMNATSWKDSCIRDIIDMRGVERIVNDQCQLGQEDGKGRPVKKPTGWMSNPNHILRSLDARCKGREGRCSRARGGMHVTRSGRVAQETTSYQLALCKAISKGFSDQLKADCFMEANKVGMQVVNEQWFDCLSEASIDDNEDGRDEVGAQPKQQVSWVDLDDADDDVQELV